MGGRSYKWLVLAGAPGLVIGGLAAWKYHALETGHPLMDRFAIRGWCLIEGLLQGIDPKHMMGIVWEESRGDPKNYVGDSGTSFGPAQVNTATLPSVGFTGDPTTLGQPGNERLAIWYAYKILALKLAEHGGDIAAAIKAYNGSGPQASAYEASEQSFESTIGKAPA